MITFHASAQRVKKKGFSISNFAKAVVSKNFQACIYLFTFFFFETGSCYVTQVDLELTIFLPHLLSAGNTGMRHHA
jgi:hypothetical protein